MDLATQLAMLSLAVAIISMVVTVVVTLPKSQRWLEEQIDRLPHTLEAFKKPLLQGLIGLGTIIRRAAAVLFMTFVACLPVFSCLLIVNLVYLLPNTTFSENFPYFPRGGEFAIISIVLFFLLCFSLIVSMYLIGARDRVRRLELIFRLPTIQRLIKESNASLRG